MVKFILKDKLLFSLIALLIISVGIFTYVLFTKRPQSDDGVIEYKFITNSDGTTTAKTPMGCFAEPLIDNDLRFVFDSIDAYNNAE